VFLGFCQGGGRPLSGRSSQKVVQGQARTEQARANGVHGQAQHFCYFRIAQLFEFAQQQNVTVSGLELRDRVAD
jgi:hypothetical protein